MKKSILIIILLIIIIAIVVGIVYFSSRDKESNIENNNNLNQEAMQKDITNNVLNDNISDVNEIQNLQDEGENTSMKNTRIKLTVNGNEVFVKLDDNVASREFLEMLPLTLTFEDFNNTEKIATLPEELSTEGLPSGYTPEVGDFSYYAPWGNVSIFYKDFRYSSSLYKLGTIESGAEIFRNLNGNFEVNIERVNIERVN